MKSLTVQIPQPCHERWADMHPTEQGRFCTSCQKTVVDYTHFSDAQVARLLNQPSATTCGRFRAGQLNKPLILSNQATNPIWQQWVGLLTMGLFSWQTAQSQAMSGTWPHASAKIPSQSTTTQVRQDSTNPTGEQIFTGTVMTIDTVGNTHPVIGANVALKGTVVITQTDKTGGFSLVLPQQIARSPTTIVISSIGYTRQEITSNRATQNLRIVLTEDTTILGEVVSVGNYQTTSEPSRWERIKSKLFQRVR